MAKLLNRYESVIYGNYRSACLKYGLWVGLAMDAYILVRWAFGIPLKATVDFGLEAILSVGILIFTYLYRKKLPEQKVFFKELMLLGLGTGVVAGFVLCLFVCLYCAVLNPQAALDFQQSMLAANPEMDVQVLSQSTAPYWGISMGLHAAILSILIAFLSALLFRTELNHIRVKPDKNTTRK